MSRWNPKLWASRKPFGLGEQRPNNYLEIWRAIKDNSRAPRYTWRILRDGVCDGCALGTTGMRDWTTDEVHLCNVRLRLLSLNTMPGMDPSVLADVETLRSRTGAELRSLGRLSHPMIRRAGERGFSTIGWDEALSLIAGRITDPQKLGVYLTSRGTTNETYYAVQRAVRAIGTNNIDNAARVCHSPSTYGLKDALGVAATTCSYTDWIGSDLIVFVGSNVANNQPVAMKYLYHARKEGTKVVCVNPYREPGMERYWIPSNVESAIFGTKITDRFFQIAVGGDVAFLSGVMKHMVENGWTDGSFVDGYTTGFDELRASLDAMSWDELERGSGTTRTEMLDFARMVGAARTAVFVWSMGVTQHPFGEDNVRAIVNLALTKGFVGRDKCGVMPIRGHSGVQGGAEMGAYSTALPGPLPITAETAAGFSEMWGFDVPVARGLTAPEMIDADLDVLISVGGNFLEVLPDPAYVRERLHRVPLRVHVDIVLASQMLVDPSDVVVLLPATTRYEIPGGVTETSTERRIIFSPEIPGPRIAQAAPEWQLFEELAARLNPSFRRHAGTQDIRDEIARTVPMYAGIETLSRKGDQVQYGGPHLCAGWTFGTPGGRARFSVVPLPERDVPDGAFAVTTRRGKQFNSMVQERTDALTGATREAVLMSSDDARRLGVGEGDRVVLKNAVGSLEGRVVFAPILPGNLEVHWPEGLVLADRDRRSPESGIPDYNAVVTVERA